MGEPRGKYMPELFLLISHHGSVRDVARLLGLTATAVWFWHERGVSRAYQAAVAREWDKARRNPRDPGWRARPKQERQAMAHELIAAFSGARFAAKRLGETPVNVRSWRYAGVPHARVEEVSRLIAEGGADG